MSSFVVRYCVCVCVCVQLTNVWVFLFVYTWSYCMLQKRTCFSWYWYLYPIRWESGTLFPSCHNFMPADILLEPLKQHKPGISIANANVCEERVLENAAQMLGFGSSTLWTNFGAGKKPNKTMEGKTRPRPTSRFGSVWRGVFFTFGEKCLSILQAVNFGSSWVDLSKKDVTTMRNRPKTLQFSVCHANQHSFLKFSTIQKALHVMVHACQVAGAAWRMFFLNSGPFQHHWPQQVSARGQFMNASKL